MRTTTRRRPAVVAATMAVAVAAVTGCTWSDVPEAPVEAFAATTCGPPPASAEPNDAADDGIDGSYVVDAPGSGEVVDDPCPDYSTFPPAGGPMAQQWANCGFYSTSVPPANAVHSLYNGAVWIAYSPDLDDGSIDIVRRTATRAPQVLASAEDGLPAPIVLTGWHRQLRLDSVQDPRFDAFVTAYLYSPDRPVVYAPCRDGLGRPDASFWSDGDG